MTDQQQQITGKYRIKLCRDKLRVANPIEATIITLTEFKFNILKKKIQNKFSINDGNFAKYKVYYPHEGDSTDLNIINCDDDFLILQTQKITELFIIPIKLNNNNKNENNENRNCPNYDNFEDNSEFEDDYDSESSNTTKDIFTGHSREESFFICSGKYVVPSKEEWIPKWKKQS